MSSLDLSGRDRSRQPRSLRRAGIPRRPRPRALSRPTATPAQAFSVVEFWREAGPSLWFAKDKDFDRRFRERLLVDARGGRARRTGRLAGDALRRAGADPPARPVSAQRLSRHAAHVCDRREGPRCGRGTAIEAGHDRAVPKELRLFIYLPFGHSEDPADQERSVALAEALGEPDLSHAKRHRDIIRRFGRFPHRNPILGRSHDGRRAALSR